MISGNMVGSYSQLGKTFILTDENGIELTGVVVGQETIFTATDNDVREGFVYASDGGVSTGTKDIPAYRTTHIEHVVLPEEPFSIPLEKFDKYNYTKLQCIIVKYDSNPNNRTSADRIVINDNVYGVNSSVALSSVTKNSKTKSIDLNIINNTTDIYMIYVFTYKEEV